MKTKTGVPGRRGLHFRQLLKHQAVSIFWLHHLQHSVPKVNIFVYIDPAEKEEERENTPRPLSHARGEVTHTYHAATLHRQELVMWARLVRPGAMKDRCWVHSTTLCYKEELSFWLTIGLQSLPRSHSHNKPIKGITAGRHLEVISLSISQTVWLWPTELTLHPNPVHCTCVWNQLHEYYFFLWCVMHRYFSLFNPILFNPLFLSLVYFTAYCWVVTH